jgi:hypothetical protein
VGTFKKGHKKVPGSGMQKGMKTKKNQAWEELGKYIAEAGAEKAQRILAEMDDDKFLLVFDKFIEYFKPKLQRTDITTDGEKIQPGPPPQIIIKLNGKDSQ